MVSRGSHVHHVPHTDLPHSIPSAIASEVNSTPSSAEAAASRSARLLRPQVGDARDEHDEEREPCEPRRRDVDVHQPLHVALDRVRGRHHEGQDGRDPERHERERAQRALARARHGLAERPLGDLHQSSIT